MCTTSFLVEQELLSLPEHLSSPRFSVGSCYSIFSFMCMFCGSLFAVLYFFFWPLCCPSFFDVQILITPLVSSNSSRHFLNSIFSSFFFGQVKRMYYPVNFVVGHSFQKINTHIQNGHYILICRHTIIDYNTYLDMLLYHKSLQNLPGYGILPYVTISVSKIPNDHTSDLMVNLL